MRPAITEAVHLAMVGTLGNRETRLGVLTASTVAD
jgi:hypothetical protein